jgi:hypothetical protein
MKTNFKGAIMLFLGVVLFYTACKKASNAPAPAAQNSVEQAAGGQIATNLVQALSGAYGGVNVNDGIAAPSLASVNKTGPSINAITSCGFFVDSTIFVKTNVGDSIKSTTTGDLEFHFKCGSNGKSKGFTIFDSLLTAGKAPGNTFTDIVVQKFDVESLNDANTKIAVDGTLKSWVDIIFNKAGSTPFSLHNRFVLTGLVVDLSSSPADIKSGTATFTSDGSSSAGIFHFTGTVVFLGNHKAEVTVNGFPFHVNFLTGVVTPG